MKIGLSRAKSPDKFDFVLVTYLILMIGMSLLSIYSAFGIIGQAAGIDYMMKQAMWLKYTVLMIQRQRAVQALQDAKSKEQSTG